MGLEQGVRSWMCVLFLKSVSFLWCVGCSAANWAWVTWTTCMSQPSSQGWMACMQSTHQRAGSTLPSSRTMVRECVSPVRLSAQRMCACRRVHVWRRSIRSTGRSDCGCRRCGHIPTAPGQPCQGRLRCRGRTVRRHAHRCAVM